MAVNRLKEDGTESVKIGTATRRSTFEEFRCHIGKCAGQWRRRCLAPLKRKPKIKNHETRSLTRNGANEEVAGLQVTVNQPEVVQERKGSQPLSR
jgi:hypothetical protein